MAKSDDSANLYDPREGGQAIRIESMSLGRKPFEPPRTNCFSVYLIEAGAGKFWADAAQFAFGPGALLFFVPYQHIRFAPDSSARGELIQFHANFLCVETFHAEVGCSGILFNDPYGIPLVMLNDDAQREVANLLARIRQEQNDRQLAFGEVMLANLKVLLILATRLKSPIAGAAGACAAGVNDLRHPALVQLRELIEANYRSMHSPAEYARRLHMTAKTLGRIVREYLGTTPSELIRNRILIHAKWQLLHTLKPVKEISRELGFGDELYFSRLFKKATGYSPSFFREFETEIRGGSNLSMFSSHAPILPSVAISDS
jgi:AraC-like DNA-binding protein